jgi:hypothetical protein
MSLPIWDIETIVPYCLHSWEIGFLKALLIVGYEWHRLFVLLNTNKREETIHVFINYRPIPIAPNYQIMHLFFFRSFEIYFLFCCIIKI